MSSRPSRRTSQPGQWSWLLNERKHKQQSASEKITQASPSKPSRRKTIGSTSSSSIKKLKRVIISPCTKPSTRVTNQNKDGKWASLAGIKRRKSTGTDIPNKLPKGEVSDASATDEGENEVELSFAPVNTTIIVPKAEVNMGNSKEATEKYTVPGGYMFVCFQRAVNLKTCGMQKAASVRKVRKSVVYDPSEPIRILDKKSDESTSTPRTRRTVKKRTRKFSDQRDGEESLSENEEDAMPVLLNAYDDDFHSELTAIKTKFLQEVRPIGARVTSPSKQNGSAKRVRKGTGSSGSGLLAEKKPKDEQLLRAEPKDEKGNGVKPMNNGAQSQFPGIRMPSTMTCMKCCAVVSSTTIDSLLVHLASHASRMPHKCSKCDCSYFEEPEMTKHIKSMHKGQATSLDARDDAFTAEWSSLSVQCFPLYAPFLRQKIIQPRQ